MMGEQQRPLETYSDNDAHLDDLLRWLDALLQLRVARYRQWLRMSKPQVAAQALYIGHEEVDWLLRPPGGSAAAAAEPPEVQQLLVQLQTQEEQLQARTAHSLAHGVYLALPQLAQLFGLSPLEQRAVVICLAPELDRKYDRIYAYLQDDVTRKRPSVDLVLELLCESRAAARAGRALFAEHAPLLRAGILQKVDDPGSPSGSSGLAQFVKLDARILDFLLCRNHLDGRLLGAARLHHPPAQDEEPPVEPALRAEVVRLVEHHFAHPPAARRQLVLHLHGPHGGGKRRLALAVCAPLRCHMLVLDAEALPNPGSEAETLLRCVLREGLLLQAAVYVQHAQELLRPELRSLLQTLAQAIREYGWLVFLGSDGAWTQPSIFEQAAFHSVELPLPDTPVRQAAWAHGLAACGLDGGWAVELAAQFRLTPGQIEDALHWAAIEAARRDASAPELADLYRACRQQSQLRLGDLVNKIEPRATWAELVLPEQQLALLREICSQVRQRHQVFGVWGFGRRFGSGKGLSVLFTGPPGTGKTLAAEVAACDLQLDLYKVDLSGVVSKYVGETEKNLARIFREAELSNAILFFDEADALFGKRTEVSDAHDRYANIETSYLLQRMEAHEGIVILATNLRENMDEAFTRRIRFIVEFPFPDPPSRRRIWATHFPPEAPVSAGLDLDYLARALPLAGGNIKNIVLNAAFLAAANGRVIGMEHVLHASRREFEKMGKLWIEAEGVQARRPPR